MNEWILMAKRIEECDEVMSRVEAAFAAAEALHLEKMEKIKAVIKVAADRVAWLQKAIDALKERLSRAVLELKAAEHRLETAAKAARSAEKDLQTAENRLRNAIEARERRREAAREAARKGGGEDGNGGGSGGHDGGDDGAVEVSAAESDVQAAQTAVNARREEEADAKRQVEKWRQTVHVLESQIGIHEARHDEAKLVETDLMARLGLLQKEGKQRIREARDRIQEERLARYRETLAGKPR